ncbi:MAG: hypothetical protein ACK5YO_30565, partial [Planctomyces sp.]
LLAVAALLVGLLATTVSARAQTPAAPQKYEHDKWKTEPQELFFEYEAFVLSFDDVDDDDGDGTKDRNGNAGLFTRNFTGFDVSTPRCLRWVRKSLNSAQLVHACGA